MSLKRKKPIDDIKNKKDLIPKFDLYLDNRWSIIMQRTIHQSTKKSQNCHSDQ